MVRLQLGFQYRLFFLLLLTVPAQAQLPDSVRSYVDTALTVLQTRSLYARTVNWQAVRDSVEHKIRGAKPYRDVFPALTYAFAQLRDHHGLVANRDTFYRYPPPVVPSDRMSQGIKTEYLKGNRIVTAELPDQVAYLRVPSMQVTEQKAMDERANWLRDSLCKVLAAHPAGLILDLRMNNGGNSAPMLSGLGPLFDRTVLGHGVDRDGNQLGPTELRNGVVWAEGRPTVSVERTCAVRPGLPVAVLIGPSTVSSGEILAVFLKQQKNVRLFGEETAGFLNATEGFLFANQQGYFLLSVHYIADASGRVYREQLVRPDGWVKSADNYGQLTTDPTVTEALNWLKKPPKKRISRK